MEFADKKYKLPDVFFKEPPKLQKTKQNIVS